MFAEFDEECFGGTVLQNASHLQMSWIEAFGSAFAAAKALVLYFSNHIDWDNDVLFDRYRGLGALLQSGILAPEIEYDVKKLQKKVGRNMSAWGAFD